MDAKIRTTKETIDKQIVKNTNLTQYLVLVMPKLYHSMTTTKERRTGAQS